MVQVESVKRVEEFDEATQGHIRKIVFEQRQKLSGKGRKVFFLVLFCFFALLFLLFGCRIVRFCCTSKQSD